MNKKATFLFAMFLVSSSVYANDKIAVVDLQQIVSNSAQVRQLKQDHSKKLADLDKIIVNARGEISGEKDPAKVLLLEDKYMKEFNTKKEALERDYNNRLTTIEKNIKAEITKKAQKDGYDYIFAKSVVLYGGKDITNELSSSIK
ncbi:MAG: OmpH family outer membrane protein [Cyanobacteria bacterium SIG31]|nr:OmpH family outer membrane protein [Cyanobacteria bacterium SIG31]